MLIEAHHTSGAETEVLRLPDRHGVDRAIVHWYSGPLDILRQMADQGGGGRGVGLQVHDP